MSANKVISAPWDAEDWRAYFDERAGILEFDEGLDRAEAEAIAWAEVAKIKRERREQASA